MIYCYLEYLKLSASTCAKKLFHLIVVTKSFESEEVNYTRILRLYCPHHFINRFNISNYLVILNVQWQDGI